MQLAGQARGWPIPAQFLSMLPYLATIIVLVTIASRGHIALGAPAHLGKSFFITR
jgi:simple sugar transport system permease protein